MHVCTHYCWKKWEKPGDIMRVVSNPGDQIHAFGWKIWTMRLLENLGELTGIEVCYNLYWILPPFEMRLTHCLWSRKTGQSTGPCQKFDWLLFVLLALGSFSWWVPFNIFVVVSLTLGGTMEGGTGSCYEVLWSLLHNVLLLCLSAKLSVGFSGLSWQWRMSVSRMLLVVTASLTVLPHGACLRSGGQE